LEPRSANTGTVDDATEGHTYDVIVVGAGIVGLATALALTDRYPGKKILVLDKEHKVGAHQTGHNSGVVHSGIYYAPGSLKAELTRKSVATLRTFCDEHSVAYEECGKVIVATDSSEVARLEQLHERGVQNGVPGLRLLSGEELKEIEPNAVGVMALHSPTTAIVDFVGVCQKIVEALVARGTEVHLGRNVQRIERRGGVSTVQGADFAYSTNYLVNCAGLHSDRVAMLAGTEPSVRIVPFRGEYYMLRPSSEHLVRGLIYPVPDPTMPFLGVHFTRMVSGGVEAGPNAVLALAREGYSHTHVNLTDVADMAGYPGFWRLARKYWRVGAFEVLRSLSKSEFVRSLRKLVPAINAEDLVRGSAGVRAQAVDAGGKLVDDFVIQAYEGGLNVLNAPSPAATAGLAIGEYIAERANLK